MFPAFEFFPHIQNIDGLTGKVPVSRGQLVARLQPPLQVGRTCRPPGQGKDYRNREKSLLFPSDAVPAKSSSSLHREMWITHRFFSDFKIAEQCFPRSLSGKQGSAGPRVALPKPSRMEGIPISAPHQYEGQPRDLQPVFWASFGTQKIPVKARVFGMGEH